jgi:hypothetical protein
VLRGLSSSESFAFDECQRQGNLLRLPWSSYDRGYLRLRQSKTGRRIVTPAGLPAKVLLDGTERRGPLILTNSSGRPRRPTTFEPRGPTGHSLKDVEAILDAHYLGRDIELAEAAAEARKQNKTVNRGVNRGYRSRRLNRQLLEMLGGGCSPAKPVSTVKFPVIREFNREIRGFGRSGSKPALDFYYLSASCGTIP